MQPTENAGQFRFVPITELVEAPYNPRRHFDEKKLAELADSVKRRGVLVPLVVRLSAGRHDDGAHYEIVAGARRFRAAQLAGLETIPVRVTDLTDEQALEIAVIENLQREDVHPLEEADGYRALLAKPGHTAESIALKVGKDPSYIYKRLKFADLIEPARKFFVDEVINASHALDIARLSAENQKKALEECVQEETRWNSGGKHVKTGKFKVLSASELRRFIEEEIYLDLAAAPWAKDDEDLVKSAGSCVACPKRTGANLALFDDTKKGDHCLDAACWNKKHTAQLVSIEKKAKAAGTTLAHISTSHGAPKGALAQHQYRKVDAKKRCEHIEQAVVVHGQGVGSTLEICRKQTCKAHWGSGSGARETRPERPFNEVWNEKLANLKARIAQQTRAAVWNEIATSGMQSLTRDELETVAARLIDRVGSDQRKVICSALGIEVRKGKYGSFETEQPLIDYVKAAPVMKVHSFLLGLALSDGLVGWGDGEAKLLAYGKECGLNADAIEKEIADPLMAKYAAAKKRALEKPPADVKAAARDRPEAAAFQKLVPSAKNVEFYEGTAKKTAPAKKSNAAKAAKSTKKGTKKK